MRYWCKNRRTYFIDRYKNNCRLVINLVARMNSIEFDLQVYDDRVNANWDIDIRRYDD